MRKGFVPESYNHKSETSFVEIEPPSVAVITGGPKYMEMYSHKFRGCIEVNRSHRLCYNVTQVKVNIGINVVIPSV